MGEWWTLLILRDIGLSGLHRFDQLQESLGIARNVLTVRLQKLVDHEVIERASIRSDRLFVYTLTLT